MFVMEQPITPAPAADFVANVLAKWNALYDAHNEMACLMLGMAYHVSYLIMNEVLVFGNGISACSLSAHGSEAVRIVV
uniref:Uncharacterized protein n=1 Tax=Tanacetum cinerariifolium TaxID=118510 RepID=A0A6L2JEH4_TANCI|nr:hypothetical protein [Tanacetum cinerariifolium]